jgi:TAG lipase/steryl ester hydrolase/phospholipase A2/LPA acyltransferase
MLTARQATSHDEWIAAATELDALEGHDAWKHQNESQEYDAALVLARLQELDDARTSCNVRRMLFLVRTTLCRDLGGMGGLRLYKHSHIGTKKLVERYIDSVEKTLEALVDVSAKQGDQCLIEPARLVQQLKCTRQSFGRSALLMSGGGTFGMNHIGVVKCLWDAHLLPRIISGASAGSIVCAVLGSKTDEEIPDVMHQFCHGPLDVFEKSGESEGLLSKLVRMFKTGGLFDIAHLRRVMRGLLGDMTFMEAYNRTRRILNIPVSTSSHFELPRLLNYITAPHVIIWSAVCTSCSVPLVYKKASLLAKDLKTGMEVPWDPNPDATWIDGSVDNDLPMTRLAEMFDVNHFIVSQVNPHVVPFLVKEEEMIAAKALQSVAFSAGPSWMGSMMSLVKGEALFRLQVLVDQGVVPSVVTKLRSVLSQRYSGDINIFPQISLVDFPRVLTNPTPEYMEGCMLTGQRATWPRLSRIQNHVAIELALDATIQKLRARLVFDALPGALRLNTSGRPSSQGYDLSQAQRSKSSYKITRFDPRTELPSPVLQRSAPTSPFLSRATLRTAHQPAFGMRDQPPSHKRLKTTQEVVRALALDTVVCPINADDSSDRDYFADPDSDSTDAVSSPSPVTSPSIQDPTLWPVSSCDSPRKASSQQVTSAAATAANTSSSPTQSDRRLGKILNLTMTSTSTLPPSSPEQRYKQLFHPSVSPSTGLDATGKLDQEKRNRSSGHGSDPPVGLSLDLSGTRGMLLRRKTLDNLTPGDATD